MMAKLAGARAAFGQARRPASHRQARTAHGAARRGHGLGRILRARVPELPETSHRTTSAGSARARSARRAKSALSPTWPTYGQWSARGPSGVAITFSEARCRRSTPVGPDELRIPRLVDRVATEGIDEVILALDATVGRPDHGPLHRRCARGRSSRPAGHLPRPGRAGGRGTRLPRRWHDLGGTQSEKNRLGRNRFQMSRAPETGRAGPRPHLSSSSSSSSSSGRLKKLSASGTLSSFFSDVSLKVKVSSPDIAVGNLRFRIHTKGLFGGDEFAALVVAHHLAVARLLGVGLLHGGVKLGLLCQAECDRVDWLDVRDVPVRPLADRLDRRLRSCRRASRSAQSVNSGWETSPAHRIAAACPGHPRPVLALRQGRVTRPASLFLADRCGIVLQLQRIARVLLTLLDLFRLELVVLDRVEPLHTGSHIAIGDTLHLELVKPAELGDLPKAQGGICRQSQTAVALAMIGLFITSLLRTVFPRRLTRLAPGAFSTMSGKSRFI